MSIQSMTKRDEIEIRRLEFTDSGEGVAVKTWTTAARNDLPTTGFKCRIQAVKPAEIVAYGIRAGIRAWRIYSSSDPFADERDHVLLSDESGGIVETRVVNPSFSSDRQGRLWTLIVEQFTPGE